jgi:hypothetical protein
VSGGSEPAYQNSGLRRFGTPQNYQPYNPGQFSAPTFQAPTLGPRQNFAPRGLSSMPGLLGGEMGSEGSAPASTPGSMPPGVANALGMGLGLATGLPGFAISGLLGLANGGVSGPGTSSVGVGAAPGTPGGIGVAVGGDGSEGSSGASSVGVGAAEGTPGGIGGIGGDGSEGSGGGGGGGK